MAKEKELTYLDVAEAWPRLSAAERARRLKQLPPDLAHEFFFDLSAADQLDVILALPPGERRPWVRLLAPDDVADVKRAGWLAALFLGEMLTAIAMARFEQEIARAVVLVRAPHDLERGQLRLPGGAMLPFILRRLGFDPASASAPFVATLVDVSGIVIYSTVASVTLAGRLL